MQTNAKAAKNGFYEAAVLLLQRKPRVPFVVKTFCPSGSPQVLLADPVFLEDDIYKPFPTVLWLVCPRLKRLVGQLEQDGLVKEYSRRLLTDESFREAYIKGQKELAALRIELAQKICPGCLAEHIKTILLTSNAAGSKDLFGVKCLHAHTAQQLAFNNNPIGAEVLNKIGVCKASDNCKGVISSGKAAKEQVL